jgi:hypothetical protein
VDAPSERIRRAKETIDAVSRVDPSKHPTAEDIAHLHEIHARHEREAGREDRAAAADKRARLARGRDDDGLSSP